MGFAARYTELRRFAAKSYPTVEQTVENSPALQAVDANLNDKVLSRELLVTTDCYSVELRRQQIRIPANGTLLGTKIFQDENNGLDSVSAAGAKLRDAKDKVLQGQ